IMQKIFDGVDSEALLAIPFFLLVGELMSSANVVVRIANLSLSLVGHIRGGLSQVVVVFSMFFSEMSGSTTADVAVMTRALGGPMKKEGYRPAFIAVIWIIAVVIPALNRGHFKNIPYDFCLAGLIFSLPLITIGAANAFGWMLAYLRGASVIADWIILLAGNDPHLMMLLLVLLFTVVGDFIEPVPTIIIFMPLVNTLTQAGDINAVHMGVGLIATFAF